MKKRLIAIVLAVLLGNSLLIVGGTYALFTAKADTQFGVFQTGTLDIESAQTESPNTSFHSLALLANYSRQTIQYPMFYGNADYPTGVNPYDKTISPPSGEIPGGWAPGDQVERMWSISNRGDGSKITEIFVDKFVLSDKLGNSVARGTQAYQDFLDHMNIAVYYPNDSSNPVYTGTFGTLVSNPQPLNTIICLRKCSTSQIMFTATMDKNAGNDLQGLKSVLNFQLGAEQTKYNCFDPPFSNWDYSMKCGSKTPIKFECYDFDGNFIRSNQNVRLVICGGNFNHTYTLGNGLSCNGGHYQANIDGDENQFVNNVTYTATVYNGSEICGQKTFKTEPGNRSNTK